MKDKLPPISSSEGPSMWLRDLNPHLFCEHEWTERDGKYGHERFCAKCELLNVTFKEPEANYGMEMKPKDEKKK